ncbi:uncharacterized protein zgc:174935 [Erpetoichthys calabaricus]|uniref:uncharacterized protein zgc:174935 n=1 Tax=Erpetoichthys calabaricus TaxID=27687 RepID=UPI002234892D|nr:uncharacterized protein zgc:174935 [Erpetoichthys calabaricus]
MMTKFVPLGTVVAAVTFLATLLLLYSRSMRLQEVSVQALELDNKLRDAEQSIEVLQQKNEEFAEAERDQKSYVEELDGKVNVALSKQSEAEANYKRCEDSKKQQLEQLAKQNEEQMQKLKAQSETDKNSLQDQINKLKTELEQFKKICEFVDKANDQGRKLCGLPEPNVKPS